MSAFLSVVDTVLTVVSGIAVGTLIARAVEPVNHHETMSHHLPSEYPFTVRVSVCSFRLASACRRIARSG